MAFKLITTAKAYKDLDKATGYYFDIQKSLAKKFNSDFRNTTKYISKNPEKIQVRYNNLHVAFLKKFPYGIHYAFENKTIIILAIFHTAMNDEKWIQQ